MQRLDDRLGSCRAVEVLDPQQVAEQPRDVALEPVELRDRVLAGREQEVDRRVATPEQRAELWEHRAVGPVVIEEELLELVENEQQRPSDPLRPGREGLGERQVVLAGHEPEPNLPGALSNRGTQRGERIVEAPRREDDRQQPWTAELFDVTERLVTELARKPRAQHGALAAAAWPVEYGDLVGAQVVGDHVAPRAAAEEPVRIRLAVRHQPLIGRLTGGEARGGDGRRRHARAPIPNCAFIPSTQSSSARSWISMPFTSQNSLSISLGWSRIDHPPVANDCSVQIWRRITRRFQSRIE